ncbi:uncharacterized protein V1518DRAFT_410660 [Limtongia smithiae]|uniref:uncharacterized protein n=1 Tax=Limtongia smithiae TaxID=1125753 RepID=UPI0034CE993F
MSLVPKVVYPIHDYAEYEPRDTLAVTSSVALPCFGISLAYATALERFKHFQAPMATSVIRIGTTSLFLASIGMSYQFVESAASNLREKNDAWNHFYGGLAGGAIMGLKARTFTSTIFSSLALGSVLGLARWAGGLYGAKYTVEEPEESAFTDKSSSFYAVRSRAPLSETLAKLGEGRGLYVPKPTTEEE